MVVTDVKASLSIYGDHLRAAARVTQVLGIEPSHSYEFGAPSRFPKRAAAGVVESQSYWSFAEPRTISSDEDPHGMESLVRLAERFASLATELATLRSEGYTMRVWMFGLSDSGQAGFVVGPATLRHLADIGATFSPDLYLTEELLAAELDAHA